MENEYQKALNSLNPNYIGEQEYSWRKATEILQELVDKENYKFENSCNAIFDEELLYKAINLKCKKLNKYCHKEYKVYLYNGYPCISISHEKYRIHQLLGEFIFGSIRKGYVIHHIDGNRLNNNSDNLQYLSHSAHSKLHNKGKKYTPCKVAIQNARKVIYRKDITKELCQDLRNQGLTMPQIAKELNCSVNTIYRRLGMMDYQAKLDWSSEQQ